MEGFELEYGDQCETIEDCPFWSAIDEDLEQGRASVPNGAEVWYVAARDSTMAEAVRDLYGSLYNGSFHAYPSLHDLLHLVEAE